MKILWVINIPLPEASILMNENKSHLGGWLVNASKNLASQNGIELTIAFPLKGIKNFKLLKGECINYYAFKPVKDSDLKSIEYNPVLKNITDIINPDVVHIHGTELAHTLSAVNTIDKEIVISIQGLVSIISKHMEANLPFKTVYGATFRNIIRKDNVIGLKRLFERRGKNEVLALKKAKHVIGRTTWDRACTNQINPTAQYHFCNETLREEFYNFQWDINKCEKNTIFFSQAHYSIKGLHVLLEALPIILKEFPNTKLFIAGKNLVKKDSVLEKATMTYYWKYISKLIKFHNLEKVVTFTGPLNEKQMCERFLKSNVFVSSSIIENESNSLSEAKILGVPCVASYVGGVTDRIDHEVDGFLYQHDASYMLAHYVCEIFKNEQITLNISRNARNNALITHDKETNMEVLLDIYKKLLMNG